MGESRFKLIAITALSALTIERALFMMSSQHPYGLTEVLLLRGSESSKVLLLQTQNETRISQLSEGADLFENVCLVDRLKEIGDPGGIYSYTKDGQGVRSPFPLDYDQAGWADFSVRTIGKPLEQWMIDSERTLVTEETVLFLDLWHNPAHCLTDIAFSMAVDLMSRTKKKSTTVPFYSKYFHMGFWEFHDTCPMSNDPNEEQWWCCNFMQQTGLLDIANGLVERSSQWSARGDPICFRKLIVPRTSAHRYPKGQLAIDSIRHLQKLAFQGTPGLIADAWTDDSLLPTKDVPLLLYDRHGTDRRILINSIELRDKLEAKYHVDVHLWGDEYEHLKFNQQAALYNSHPRILAPHGAHLANLFFARPGTKTMEVACPDNDSLISPRHPNVNLTSLADASSQLEWYGDARFFGRQWFASFTQGLFIEHFVYEEFEGCKEDGSFRLDYSPQNVTLNVEEFLPFVASRFGLQQRQQPKQQPKHKTRHQSSEPTSESAEHHTRGNNETNRAPPVSPGGSGNHSTSK